MRDDENSLCVLLLCVAGVLIGIAWSVSNYYTTTTTKAMDLGYEQKWSEGARDWGWVKPTTQPTR